MKAEAVPSVIFSPKFFVGAEVAFLECCCASLFEIWEGIIGVLSTSKVSIFDRVMPQSALFAETLLVWAR